MTAPPITTTPQNLASNYISQLGTIVYFGFFLLMPWWSRLGTFKPLPDRVHFRAH
jgi:ubiquinol-cytochrome c reductase cytochrome b subunit